MQMSGLPREGPCSANITAYSGNICDVQTKDVLQRLSNQSLLFPPWSRPSYRCTKLRFSL